MESFIDLPKARYGSGVSERSSTIITMADQGPNLPPAVYLGDGKSGQPLPEDPELQEAEIVRAVEAGLLQEGKPNVLLKAEKGIKHREVSRVAAAASQVEGIKLHLAVTEAS
jgi:biopolymer transport protein ExbD